MTTLTKALNSIDEYVDMLESKVAVLEDLTDIHRKTIISKAKTIASLQEDVQHWQALQEREHHAFELAAADRDQALIDKANMRRRLRAVRDEYAHAAEALELKQAEYDAVITQLELALRTQAKLEEFVDTFCDMVADEADMEDIADLCIKWRRDKWSIEDLEAEDQRRSDPRAPYKWKVMVVEHSGDEAVFTGWFANYDLARESVDLMIARGCHEAWVEELV